ncbi:glycosyltransferase family 2 protein [Flavobacterium silvaticum]|uniref:Glycosyltransferase family 2 protein n=1 Tax=Flavobacterium silvaticum TaxID=1852020 RepID=A0A972JIL2_9FLAO|nr:glycosyltransferase family 2 protein [Flavobacterium silvaticum]NMH28378.1 glycosyltransferase family 2 protein [Flavobacterium silvaticum]
MEALVSIITPTFNSGKFVSETILSVQNQTHTNWELLLVDDCSTDDTIEAITPFLSDSRIKLHKLDVNSGAGIARNRAVSLAKGDYIAFVDSDDLWKPEKLRKQLDFMRQNSQPFTFSFYDCIDEDGKSLHKCIEAPRNLSYRQLFFCNFVGNLTGMYSVAYFGKIGISSIRKRQDWILWLTILRQLKKAKPVPESLAFYRVRKDSISASKWKLLKSNYVVYKDFHKLNSVVSVLAMCGFLFTQLLVKPRFSKKAR